MAMLQQAAEQIVIPVQAHIVGPFQISDVYMCRPIRVHSNACTGPQLRVCR